MLKNLGKLSDLVLEGNLISDITIISENKGVSGKINLKNNPLSNTTYTTHIPALIKRGITVEYDAAPAGTVTFKDANLEKAIRDALGIPTELLKKEDLAGLKELVVKRGITNFTGIEHCTNLTYLNIDSNQISDLSLLANLANLTALSIDTNQLTDVSPLTNLANLTQLWLHYNQLSDIGALANLTNLTWLELKNNQLNDVSPLTNLTNPAG